MKLNSYIQKKYKRQNRFLQNVYWHGMSGSGKALSPSNKEALLRIQLLKHWVAAST